MAYDNPVARTFSSEFNRRLGQYTRNPSARTPEEALTLDLSARLLNDRQREQAAEKMDRQAYADKIWEDQFKDNGSGGLTLKSPSTEPKYGALSQETADLLTDPHNSGIASHIDIPSWLPGNDIASRGIQKVAGPFKSPTLWLLDKLSRPSYGEFEGLQSYFEARNNGENPLEALDNVAKGVGRGLKGEDKTGFGDIIETMAETPESKNPLQGDYTWTPENGGEFLGNLKYIGRNLDRLGPFSTFFSNQEAEQHGGAYAFAQRNAKRAAGFAGEVFADPTNAVGGKVFTAVGDSVKAGQHADEAYRTLVRQTVDDAVNKRGLDAAYKLDVRRPMRRPDPNNPGKFISPNLPVGRTLLQDAAERGIDNATLRIGGGATGGRTIGAQIGAMSIADNVSNEMRNVMLKNFDQVHKTFDDILSSSKTLTKAEIAQLRKDPIVAAYLDELLRITKKANPASSLTDVERILLKYAPRNKDRILSYSDQAASYAKSQLDNTVADIREDIFKGLDNQVKNIPGVRIGNKGIPLKRVGMAYHAARSKLGTPLEAVQFEKQFPSITPQIANAVKSTGQEAYEKFHAAVQAVARDLPKEERKAFNQRILTNTPAPTAKLQAAQDFIQRAYREIWQDEVDAGIRSADEIMPNNYVYNYYKPKGLHPTKYNQEIDHYRASVKTGVKGSKSLAANHISLAKAKGLKVEEDAFRALLYRKLKSNRQLTQAWFKESLLDNYGVMANRMSDKLRQANRLTPINAKLTKRLKAQLGEGDKWYLPDDINKVFERYVNLTNGTKTEELSQFIHTIDTVTRWFKQAATIYYPGFHVRNSMGDMFMSFLDGVRASDYTDLKRILGRVQNNPNATIDIAGQSFSWAKIKQLFDENVSTGGFKRTDFDTPDIGSKINPNRGVAHLRNWSESREDFFRFTHFLHAFKEELPAAMKQTKNYDTAVRNATRASAYRVNKYLFDYGATTQFEKSVLKRVFPFYTYTRKVMPALAEAMYLHPSQFAKTNRFFLDDDNGSYADMLTPDYLREAGYRNLSGPEAENPWLLSGDFLPTGVLNKNTNVFDIPGFARNILGQSNPLVKAGPELAAGKTFWNDKPIQGTGPYVQDSFLPPIRPTQKLFDAAQGLPGIPGEGNKTKFLSGRFGIGLPIAQVTNSQQTATLYGILDKYKAEIGKFNPKLEENGFRMYVSPRKDGASFRIRNEQSGDVIVDTTDLAEAIRRAKELSK